MLDTKNWLYTFSSGFPNVGKSSVLNSLVGRKVVSVSRTPGHTKYFQTYYLTPTVKLCDCPGLVFPSLVNKQLQVQFRFCLFESRRNLFNRNLTVQLHTSRKMVNWFYTFPVVFQCLFMNVRVLCDGCSTFQWKLFCIIEHIFCILFFLLILFFPSIAFVFMFYRFWQASTQCLSCRSPTAQLVICARGPSLSQYWSSNIPV